MNDFFDSDFEVEETGCVLAEQLWYRDTRKRRLFLLYEINMESVEPVVREIVNFNSIDRDIPAEKRKPIYLYISSPGGEADSGFMLIDAIKTSKTPVYTVNLGTAYSMAFFIAASGKKRYAMPSAKYLIHDGINGVLDSGAKVQDRISFQQKVAKKTKQFVMSNTAISSKEYDKNLRVEWYMFADEAKAKGIVDYIIGEDCDIDEVTS